MRLDTVVAAEPRSSRGKNEARRTRVAGKIPAIVYGAFKDPQAVSVNPKDILKIIRGKSGHNSIFDVEIAGVERTLPLFEGNPAAESDIVLRPPTAADDVWSDYATTGQSLGPHPVSFVRTQLRAKRCRSAREAGELEHGSPVRYAGLVLLRQQPATASGVTFVTLEDETGTLNAVVWRDVGRKFWRVFRESSLLAIDGVIERHDGVQHLVAKRLQDYSPMLMRLDARSRDFR